MWVTFSINLINIAGNYLFLYGTLTFLKMGVAGVAISTVVARLLAAIALFGFFYITKTGRIFVIL